MAKAEKPAAPVAFLDKEALLKQHKVPLILKPVAGALIDWLNSFDADHDGVPDLAKWLPIVLKVSPLLLDLAKQIDWSALLAQFARDKRKALATLESIKAEGKSSEGGA